MLQLDGLMGGAHALLWAPVFPRTSPFVSFASFVTAHLLWWEEMCHGW